MVFGEIIEPSSRALWEDDFIDYPDEDLQEFQWEGTADVPEIINRLIIGETPRIVTLLQKCVLDNTKPICELINAGIKIYNISDDSYVVMYTHLPDVIVGKITEKLIPWLRAAKDIYALASSSITLLQNCRYSEASPCVIRSLCASKSQSSPYERLEVPNMVTGLSASILSYSVHEKLLCTLYMGFFEEVPLDSHNTQPFLNLLQQIGVGPLRPYKLQETLASNNLYM